MPAPAITYAELKSLNPCADALRRITKLMGGAKSWTGKIDAATARNKGATLDDIVWVASALARKNNDIERRLRLWMADCAAHVLHNFENEYPADDRPRNAIIAARQFARGEIGSAAWSAVWSAAESAAESVARSAAWSAAWSAVWSAAWSTTESATESVARSAAWSAAWSAESAEENWQFDRLILWLSENEPADYPLPDRKAEVA